MEKKTENKKETKKNASNIKHLRRVTVFAAAALLLGMMLAACYIVELYDPNFYGPRWPRYLTITCCFFMSISIAIVLYQFTHYRGYYRCKECGHIHAPEDEALAEMLLDSKNSGVLICPKCAVKTKHKKLGRKEIHLVPTTK